MDARCSWLHVQRNAGRVDVPATHAVYRVRVDAPGEPARWPTYYACDACIASLQHQHVQGPYVIVTLARHVEMQAYFDAVEALKKEPLL